GSGPAAMVHDHHVDDPPSPGRPEGFRGYGQRRGRRVGQSCSRQYKGGRQRNEEAGQGAGALQPRWAPCPLFLLRLDRHGYTRSRAAAAPIAAGKARITTLAAAAWTL